MEDPEHIQLSPQVTNIAEDLKSLFSSKGRISPGRAMWHSLILFLLAVLLGSTSGVLAQDKSSGYLIFGLAYFATIFLGLVAGVKRAHDLGRSGTEVLFLCVPLVNIIYGLKLTFQKGDTGPNAYGPDPLETPLPKGGAISLFLGLVAMIVLMGNLFLALPESRQVLSAVNPPCSVSVPYSWEEEPPEEPTTVLQAYHSYRMAGMWVKYDPKSEGENPALESYAQTLASYWKDALSAGSISELTELRTNKGSRAYAFNATLAVEGSPLTYFVSTLETPDEYFLLFQFCEAERFSAERPEMEKVLQSFECSRDL